jgi:PPE-repeat protein
LCPVLNGVPTLRCGPDCYLPEMYSCGKDGKLVYPGSGSPGGVSTATATVSASASGSSGSPSSSSTAAGAICSENATTLHLSDPPYENYFYSDCHGANQIVVSSPLSDSNLTIIGPRLLVAWPAGNSGTVAFFAPQNGVNGSLGIAVVNGTYDQPLSPVYDHVWQCSRWGIGAG